MKQAKKITPIQNLPPNAIDLEEAVLGGVILESDSYHSISGFLKVEHFYKEDYSLIWKAIQDLGKSKSPIDMLTVSKQLAKNGDLEAVGGAYAVSTLTERIGSSTNVEYYARIIVQKYLSRELIMISSTTTANCYRDEQDVFELLEELKAKIKSIEQGLDGDKAFKTIKDIGTDYLKDLEAKRSGIKPPLISSGLTDLYGFANSDSVIVGARPGMGKTAFLLKAVRQQIKTNKVCAVFSLEMSAMQLLNRLASAECEIDSEKLALGKLEAHEMNKVHAKVKELENSKLYIDDTPALDIDRLCAKARKLKREQNIEILFIDYLGLITTKHYVGQKTNEIGYISRTIKQLARELDIPIVTLAQLSRKIEERIPEKRMPNLSDLRDSGDIEQDADQVIFIFRPQYYKLNTFMLDGQEVDVRGKAFFEYAKNRHGSLSTVLTRFIGKFTDFRDDYKIVKEEPSQTSLTRDLPF
jgi:replicative DNA helicase